MNRQHMCVHTNRRGLGAKILTRNRQTYRQTDRQRDRQTDRRTDRQTDRSIGKSACARTSLSSVACTLCAHLHRPLIAKLVDLPALPERSQLIRSRQQGSTSLQHRYSMLAIKYCICTTWLSRMWISRRRRRQRPACRLRAHA